MTYYDEPKNVDQYEKMCQEYDGTNLYQFLEKHLTEGSTILELGTGPGHDLEHFQERYKPTGSDLSEEFIRRLQTKFPSIKFHHLDATSIQVEGLFDCLYSNKVLHHLTLEQLEQSLQRQKEVIKANGFFAHTFWLGDKEETMHGMYFLYHNRQTLLDLIAKYFEVIDCLGYAEFSEGDSIFVIAKNNK